MRILAATDGSAPANRAVELAARLTKELNGSLKVIHVCSERDVPEEQLSDYTISEHASSPKSWARSPRRNCGLRVSMRQSSA